MDHVTDVAAAFPSADSTSRNPEEERPLLGLFESEYLATSGKELRVAGSPRVVRSMSRRGPPERPPTTCILLKSKALACQGRYKGG